MFKFYKLIKKIRELLSGYKTYIVVIAGVVLSVLEHFGIPMPAWVIGEDVGILPWLFGGAIRAAMQKFEPVIQALMNYWNDLSDE